MRDSGGGQVSQEERSHLIRGQDWQVHRERGVARIEIEGERLCGVGGKGDLVFRVLARKIFYIDLLQEDVIEKEKELFCPSC